MTANSISSYLKYETVVGIRRVKETEVEFPQVTICNLNAFDVGTDEFSGSYINRVRKYYANFTIHYYNYFH